MNQKAATTTVLPSKKPISIETTTRKAENIASKLEKSKTNTSNSIRSSKEFSEVSFSGQTKDKKCLTRNNMDQKKNKDETETTPLVNKSDISIKDQLIKRKERPSPIQINFLKKEQMQQDLLRRTLGQDMPNIVSKKPNKKQVSSNIQSQLEKPSKLRKSSFEVSETQFEKKPNARTNFHIKEVDDNNEEQNSKCQDLSKAEKQLKKSQNGLKYSLSTIQLQQSEKQGKSFHPTNPFAKEKSKKAPLLKTQKSMAYLNSSSSELLSSLKKNITLRDYLHLTQLSAKSNNHQDLSATTQNITISSISSPKTALSSTQLGKRKAQASNIEIMGKIRKQISTDLIAIQQKLKILSDICKMEIEDEPSQEQIMKVVAISRMLKEKVGEGSDQIVRLMQQS